MGARKHRVEFGRVEHAQQFHVVPATPEPLGLGTNTDYPTVLVEHTSVQEALHAMEQHNEVAPYVPLFQCSKGPKLNASKPTLRVTMSTTEGLGGTFKANQPT